MSLPPRYKRALVAVLLAAPGLALAAEPVKVAGALLPDDAVTVGEMRYQTQKSWEETLKFFRSLYGPGKYTRRPIADQPALKAIHIENPDARPGGWEGLNVYEAKGQTRIFVLVKPKPPPKPR
jgi:hypothetical protein